jgi:hypothetical protein
MLTERRGPRARTENREGEKMSGWIDIRVRKPTAADGDKRGRILQRLKDDALCVCPWNDLLSVAAWMPIPELTPLPDPPEGFEIFDPKPGEISRGMMAYMVGEWRQLVDIAFADPHPLAFCYARPIAPPKPPEGWRYVQAGESFDKRAKYWCRTSREWHQTRSTGYDPPLAYIVPIDPPAPTYRPFASAAEFDAYVWELWRYKSDPPSTRRPLGEFNDRTHNNDTWQISLEYKIFCDGTPFGVKVEG